MKKFSDDYGDIYAKLFKSSDGLEVLIFDYEFGLNQVFIRDTSKSEVFYETTSSGSSSSGGSNGKESRGGLHYYAERKYNSEFRINTHKENGVIIFGGSTSFEFLEKQEISNADILKLSYIPLPELRNLESAWIAQNDECIVISNLEFSGGESHKLHIGQSGNMREIEIESHSVMRDGGTTIIKTEEGTFFTPTPFNQDPQKFPTWKDEPVKRIKIDDILYTYKLTLILKELNINTKSFKETLKED